MAEGSVLKKVRKDGKVSYQARIDMGSDAAGKRVRKIQEFGTKKEATAALQQWRVERDRGGLVPATRQDVRAYMLGWMEGKRAALAPSTAANYEWWIVKHILPHLGGVALSGLTTQRIERWRDTLAKELGPRSVQLALSILKQATARAVRTRVLAVDPGQHVECPKQRVAQVAVWELDDARRFLQEVGADPLYAAWLVALGTGLRRGELVALRWEDLDLGAGILRVRKAVSMEGSRPSTGDPKSRAGIRTLSLDGITRAALIEHGTRAAQTALDTPGWVGSGLVFTTRRGTGIHPDAMTHKFRRVADRAGMPHVSLHSLRHTAAALALASGANVKLVSTRLGHAKTAITVDTYAYALQHQDREAAEGVSALLFGSRQPAVNLERENRPL